VDGRDEPGHDNVNRSEPRTVGMTPLCPRCRTYRRIEPLGCSDFDTSLALRAIRARLIGSRLERISSKVGISLTHLSPRDSDRCVPIRLSPTPTICSSSLHRDIPQAQIRIKLPPASCCRWPRPGLHVWRGRNVAARSDGLTPILTARSRSMTYVERPNLVHVRPYDRTRLGRREHVREHWRSWPRQLDFGF